MSGQGLQDIVGAVAREWGGDADALRRPAAHGAARPRHVAMYLAADLTGRTLGEIALFFRAHESTVHLAIRRTRLEMRQMPALAARVGRVRAGLAGGEDEDEVGAAAARAVEALLALHRAAPRAAVAGVQLAALRATVPPELPAALGCGCRREAGDG